MPGGEDEQENINYLHNGLPDLCRAQLLARTRQAGEAEAIADPLGAFPIQPSEADSSKPSADSSTASRAPQCGKPGRPAASSVQRRWNGAWKLSARSSCLPGGVISVAFGVHSGASLEGTHHLPDFLQRSVG